MSPANGICTIMDRLRELEVNPLLFRTWLREVENEQQKIVDYVAGLGLLTLPVDYEDLLLNERATLDRVCSFLGIQS
jgi:hypothetical protein